MNPNKGAQMAWPVMVVMLTGVYGYWTVHQNLVSSRPSTLGVYDVPDPVPTPGVHTTHARMWQDPLTSAYDSWKRLPESQRLGEMLAVSDDEDLDERVKGLVESAIDWQPPPANKTTPCDDPAEDPSQRQAKPEKEANPEEAEIGGTPEAGKQAEDDGDDGASTEPKSEGGTGTLAAEVSEAVAGAKRAGAALARSAQTRDAASEGHARNAKQMREFFRSLVHGGETVCMLVAVPGGPYAEDKEKRMRTRYAVSTAMAESGYILKYPQRMTYLTARLNVRVLRGWQERELVVPFKLYRHDTAPQVLVVWLNEAELGLRPLLSTHRLLSNIFAETEQLENLTVSMIGPASSDTLEVMALELAHLHDAHCLQAMREARGVLAHLPADGEASADEAAPPNQRIDVLRQKRDELLQAVKRRDACPQQLLEPHLAELNRDSRWTVGEALGRATKGLRSQATAPDPDLDRLANACVLLRVELATLDRSLVMHSRLDDLSEQALKCQQAIRKAGGPMASDESLERALKLSTALAEAAEVCLTRIRLCEANRIQRVAMRIRAAAAGLSDEPLESLASSIALGSARLVLQLGDSLKFTKVAHAWHVDSYQPAAVLEGPRPMLSSRLKGLQLFSPRATAHSVPRNSFIDVCRVIGSDKELAAALRDELVRRGATGEIALITEHDTTYGRQFPETFEAAFEEAHEPTKLLKFKILKGIDGKLPHDDDRSGDPLAAAAPGGSPNGAPAVVERRPEGRTQYDYLRRLRRAIEQHRDIAAIGVVGTDLYDKLLVMRALKPHFPQCVFFTTDLDASYIHSNELRHTRNLLIASHFGLRLGDELQESTPPFRDSYQTATFLATRLAIRKAMGADAPLADSEEREPWQDVIAAWSGDSAPRVPPVLHVVGSDYLHALPLKPDKADPDKPDRRKQLAASAARHIHPEEADSSAAWHYFFISTLTLTAMAVAWLSVYRDKYRRPPLREHRLAWGVTTALAVAGVGLFVLHLAAGFYGLESAPFFGGYSSWPRDCLDAATGLAAVAATVYLLNEILFQLQDLHSHREEIGELASRCFGPWQIAKIFALTLVVLTAGSVFVYEPDSWAFIVPATAALIGLGAACILLSRAAHRRTQLGDGDSTAADPNLILTDDLTRPMKWALAVSIGVMAVGLIGYWATYRWHHVGWHPRSISRSDWSRLTDGLANGFAFSSVALFSSAVLFLHLWYREFARRALVEPPDRQRRYVAGLGLEGTAGGPAPGQGDQGAREEYAEDERAEEEDAEFQEGMDSSRREFAAGPADEDAGDADGHEEIEADDGDRPANRMTTATGRGWRPAGYKPQQLLDYARKQHERLWAVSRLTGVTDTMAPVLILIYLLLLLAYHPLLSPTPMPLSLLALTSLAIVVLIFSAVSLRMYFSVDRDGVVDQLRMIDEELEPLESTSDSNPLPREFELLLAERDAGPGDISVLNRKILGVWKRQQQRQDQVIQLRMLISSRIRQIEALSEGVFRPWSQSGLRWVLGGGTSVALFDLWMRWWMIGL